MMIIPELGLFSLVLAFLLACVLALSPFIVSNNRTAGLLWGQFAFVLLGFSTLILCFLQNNFSVNYVASNSYTDLPFIYKFCATWGAHEGSLLLWILMLTGWALLLKPFQNRSSEAVLGGICAGFLFILLQTSNPFLRILPEYPAQGIDLNPLLQDPGFIIHPPFLYLGYVGFAIPFACSIGALLKRDQTEAWVKMARPFALMAWGFLTIGIALGSWWAYYELGWGGWWFWDPVENASLMPWLMGGALCHALMLASHRKQYLGWCHLLAIGTFILSLMGTFLVRSGMISSVHAFAADPKRGIYILVFLFAIMMGSFLLYTLRWRSVSVSQKEEILSKGSGILLGNILLVVMTFTVLLGTLYPLFMEVIAQKRMSVGGPYFQTMFMPLVAALLLCMSIVPYIHWEKERFISLLMRFKNSTVLLIIVGIFICLKLPFGLQGMGLVLAAGLIMATLGKVLQKRQRANWGMVLAHIGLAISIMGMILVNHLESEQEMRLAIGQSVSVGQTKFTFQQVERKQGPNYEGRRGHFLIAEKSKPPKNLYPEKRYFQARELVMTETAILPGFLKDYYIALGELYDDDTWSVKIYVKPFVRWIWLGALFIAFGAFYSGFCSWQQMRKNNECK